MKGRRRRGEIIEVRNKRASAVEPLLGVKQRWVCQLNDAVGCNIMESGKAS